MDILLTLFYILFSICVVYPPVEFITAGFTLPQLMDNYLGSENTNFMKYHMRRVTITALFHSVLPIGYVFTLLCGGERGPWLPFLAFVTMFIPFFMACKVMSWWGSDKRKHPVIRPLLPYVTPGSDWGVVAVELNVEFRSVDKVSITLNATNKFIATRTWFIKVTQYGINLIKQSDCALVATATDSHNFSTSGENEVQYLNIETVPSREDIKKFTFRISTASLRDLQPILERPVRVPDHISLMPTLIERFVNVFKQHVEHNPIYYTDQELELCIGCMQNPADVKLNKHCAPLPDNIVGGPPACQQCNCRALWCCACIARWWATRAPGKPETWLAARGSCPVCRASFCLLDVCLARRTPQPT